MKRVTALALALVVTACSEEAPAPAKQQAAASGEVLGGSISDAMIPLDQIESQAPLAPRQAPPAGSVDAEQPEVTTAPGIEDAAPSQEAEAPPAAPTPEPAE
jgi:hypothetical protein